MVGGCLGLGKTQTRTSFEIKKVSFAIGEGIKLVLDCDNSKCNNSVKSFKFKLYRKIEVNITSGKSTKTLRDAFQFDSKDEV